MSEKLLQEFLSQGLLTSSLPQAQFIALISASNEGIPREQLVTVYEQLKTYEQELLGSTKSRARQFLHEVRSNSKNIVEATQMKSTVSVEALVNSLYSAHQLLDEKATQLNSDIDSHMAKLHTIKEQMKPLQTPAAIDPILGNLRYLLTQAEVLQD
ncbi:LAME_0H04720g1_1 [Lachancea meyersii CBS 8951]|uniref:LAME_0H04720g1_1 n=1 Tax=Lachancea meyersii CBS 8951 TaxID=1266667 RepID=A0A1G4KE01_9SACH|nr:LAME_0H04720g1_1 [Lachancea meyersii CBS 8951]